MQASAFNYLIPIESPSSFYIPARWDVVWLCIQVRDAKNILSRLCWRSSHSLRTFYMLLTSRRTWLRCTFCPHDVLELFFKWRLKFYVPPVSCVVCSKRVCFSSRARELSIRAFLDFVAVCSRSHRRRARAKIMYVFFKHGSSLGSSLLRRERLG